MVAFPRNRLGRPAALGERDGRRCLRRHPAGRAHGPGRAVGADRHGLRCHVRLPVGARAGTAAPAGRPGARDAALWRPAGLCQRLRGAGRQFVRVPGGHVRPPLRLLHGALAIGLQRGALPSAVLSNAGTADTVRRGGRAVYAPGRGAQRACRGRGGCRRGRRFRARSAALPRSGVGGAGEGRRHHRTRADPAHGDLAGCRRCGTAKACRGIARGRDGTRDGGDAGRASCCDGSRRCRPGCSTS